MLPYIYDFFGPVESLYDMAILGFGLLILFVFFAFVVAVLRRK